MRMIVVGGGIGGLTAAIALKQAGVGVEVYERAAAITEVGAGVSLWPNALKALHLLGMQPSLEAMSFVSEVGGVRTPAGTMLTETSAREFVARFGLPTTVFHRAELLDVLLDAAGDIPIHLGHECRTVEQNAGQATVHFADGRTATADAIVGADGLRSAVRACLRVPGELRYSGYTAWRGIAPFDTQGLIAGETVGCGRRFGLVPVAGNRVYWYATENTAEGRRESAGAMKTRLLDLFRGWHEPITALLQASDAAAILHNDIYDRDPVDRWGSGRVTLLGDAAHPMTPNLGQGACQAIEDALVLASRVAGASDVAAALRRYEADRIPRTRSIVLASRRVGRFGQIQSPAMCRLRNVMVRLVPRSMTYRHLASVVGYEEHLGGPPGGWLPHSAAGGTARRRQRTSSSAP